MNGEEPPIFQTSHPLFIATLGHNNRYTFLEGFQLDTLFFCFSRHLFPFRKLHVSDFSSPQSLVSSPNFKTPSLLYYPVLQIETHTLFPKIQIQYTMATLLSLFRRDCNGDETMSSCTKPTSSAVTIGIPAAISGV